jgi:hypothetical protein
VDRLRRLAALGLDKIAIAAALSGVSQVQAAASGSLMRRRSLPRYDNAFAARYEPR